MSYPSAPEKPLRIVQSLPRNKNSICEGCDFDNDSDKCYNHIHKMREFKGIRSVCFAAKRIWKVIQ